jgi:hypothetical protein
MRVKVVGGLPVLVEEEPVRVLDALVQVVIDVAFSSLVG